MSSDTPGADDGSPLLPRARLIVDIKDADAVRLIAQPIARALTELALGYQSVTLEKGQLSSWRGAMSQVIRKYHDVVIPALVAPAVSEGAMELAEARGIDLQSMSWGDRTSFNGSRKQFHLEHYYPVGRAVEDMLNATRIAHDDEVMVILTGKALQVAWILKEEDQRLSAAGFRHRRPDPRAAYAMVGITLVGAAHPEPSSDRVLPPVGEALGPGGTLRGPRRSGPRPRGT